MDIKDLIIIGGGPAGLSAGIYAMRLNLDTLLIEKALPGGLTASVNYIENYPGFPEGITGIELMQKMEAQARRFGLKIITDEVLSIWEERTHGFASTIKIKTSNGEYIARTIIIATGAQYKKLNVPGEDKLIGKGVSYCAVCDGPLFKNKNIAVIGCGNSGIQEGLFLLNFANHITFVEFLESITADPILRERALNEGRVNFLLGYSVVSINGEDKVVGVTVRHRKTGEIKTIDIDGVFIYVGLIPNTNWLKRGINLDSQGYVITDDKLETSWSGVPHLAGLRRGMSGVFAAGDVRHKPLPFFQVISAASEGAFAAYAVKRYIEK
jgi:thioredoxin reductase (NADPH)